MTLLAVVLLVRPLLRARRVEAVDRGRFNVEVYRDRVSELDQERAGGGLSDAELAASKAELEQELLADVAEGDTAPDGSPGGARGPITAVAVAVLVPVLAVTLYLELGEPRSLAGAPELAGMPAQHPATQGGDEALPDIQQMAEGLAARLEQDPDSLEGWVMLGRTYQVMERFDSAQAAFARAVELSPRNPDLLARYAESKAMARQGRLAGEPMDILATALELDPDHPSSLWLMGMGARQQGELEKAVEYWQRLRPQLSGEEAATLDGLLAETRGMLAGDGPVTVSSAGPAASAPPVAAEPAPAPAAEPAVPAAEEAAGGAALEAQVDLTPELRESAAPEDTVFIFARAAEGPRMPLAIVRTTVAALPTRVTLDDSMAMTPAMTLSTFPQVVVGARVSKSGNAMPQAGDLEGTSEPVAPDHEAPVQVTIDRRI